VGCCLAKGVTGGEPGRSKATSHIGWSPPVHCDTIPVTRSPPPPGKSWLVPAGQRAGALSPEGHLCGPSAGEGPLLLPWPLGDFPPFPN
jgi:hypothetical protein